MIDDNLAPFTVRGDEFGLTIYCQTCHEEIDWPRASSWNTFQELHDAANAHLAETHHS